MMVRLILMGFLVLAYPASSEPVQWTVDQGGNGHWYEWVQTNTTWYQALADAQSMGWEGAPGYLATITSNEEEAFVESFFPPVSPPDFRCFVGGYQLEGSAEPAGGWTWITGEAWEFSNWGPNEPSDYPGGEWILEIVTSSDGSYHWNDNTPDRASDDGFVVEYSGVIPVQQQSWSSLKFLY